TKETGRAPGRSKSGPRSAPATGCRRLHAAGRPHFPEETEAVLSQAVMPFRPGFLLARIAETVRLNTRRTYAFPSPHERNNDRCLKRPHFLTRSWKYAATFSPAKS